MYADEEALAQRSAQLNKIRHAQVDFQSTIGEGFFEDAWANLPIEHLHQTAVDLSNAVASDEVTNLASRQTAVEWANLMARLHHGAGGWDPWAGRLGSEHARATDDVALRPEGTINPVDDPSNSNVNQDSSSMRDLVDLDQRKMNPGTDGILEVDIWGRTEFRFDPGTGYGMRLSGVSAHVKDLIAEHSTLGDIKMNKLVTIYWDPTLNPPKPYARFLITADGYIRSHTMLGDEQLDAAAKLVQSLSPTAIV